MRAYGVGIAEFSRLTERWLSWLDAFARTYGLDPDFVERLRARVEEEYPNLLAAIRWCQQEGRHTSLLQLAEGIYEYAYFACLFNDFDEISQMASLSASIVNDQRAIAVSALQRGRVAFLRNQYALASPSLEVAERLAEHIGDYHLLGRVWGYHSFVLLQLRKFPECETRGQSLIVLGRPFAFNPHDHIRAIWSGVSRFRTQRVRQSAHPSG